MKSRVLFILVSAIDKTEKNSSNNNVDAASPSCHLPSWLESSSPGLLPPSPSRDCDSDPDNIWGVEGELRSHHRDLHEPQAPSDLGSSVCQSSKGSGAMVELEWAHTRSLEQTVRVYRFCKPVVKHHYY